MQQEKKQDRAAQFAPFDALKGYSGMLSQLQNGPEPRRILSEEAAEVLSARLAALRPGDRVLLRYYDTRVKRYKNVCGQVREADFTFRTLRVGQFVIPFSAVHALRVQKSCDGSNNVI